MKKNTLGKVSASVAAATLACALTLGTAGAAFADDAVAAEGSTDSVSALSDTDTNDEVAVQKWYRLAGDNAYGTMNKIVKAGWSSGSDVVILANYDSYWDALTASGLAGFYNAPILLTDGTTLNEDAQAYIDYWDVSKVIAVGGTSVISKNIETQVAKLNSGNTAFERYWGANAAGTAYDIYCQATESGNEWGRTAIIATGSSYYDALAISSLAYNKHYPIFLAQTDSTLDEDGVMHGTKLGENTINALVSGDFDKIIIVGGTEAVSSEVETEQLKNLSKWGMIERLAGENAVETSQKVAAYGLTQGLTATNMGVATTSGYWDALCGAAFCGKLGSVMTLVNPTLAEEAANGFVADHASDIGRGYIFGGSDAIPDSAQEVLENATKE